MSNVKKIKFAKVAERILIACLAVAVAGLVFAISGHATAKESVSTPVATTIPELMGPANTDAKFVGNTVPLPKIAGADCFNVYRDGKLIAPCVKPKIESTKDGDFYYFDDASPEVTPASRWTYEVSAVNATGESPRYGQGGPYNNWNK